MKKKAKPTPLVIKPEFQDISNPKFLEIQIRNDSKVIWINIDGICVFRAYRIKNLILTGFDDAKRKGTI